MNKPLEHAQAQTHSFERLAPDASAGLTAAQVSQRMAAGAHNVMPTGLTPTVGRIILKNVCTLFNLINLALAVAILLVGSPKNALFFGVAVCNTALGIIQELRAKRTLDKLSIMAQAKAAVVRDGQCLELPQDQVVLDDILYLAQGNQICADSVVVNAEGLEVDESLLTGEADSIRKKPGDTVMSGSFVVAGHGWVRTTAVGKDNYATRLTVEAKKEKKPKSQLMRTLNNIIRVLTFVIIPVGLLLFYTQYNTSGDLDGSVLGASAAMIGMIPEGLILLTGVTLTVGAMNLAKKKALVQALPSIETLARVDVLCLDKTGTITDGTLSFEELIAQEGCTEEQAGEAVAQLMTALHDENGTATALRGHFGACQSPWQAALAIPFSSARKYSAAVFAGRGSYVLGAPDFVFPTAQNAPFFETVRQKAALGQRVLCLAHSSEAMQEEGGLPNGLACLALVVLSDTIRKEAPDTFRFFESEGVVLKVISGDDALTVSTIAKKAGITGAEHYINLGEHEGKNISYGMLVEKYTVFGRVTPQQKRELIRALEAAGHTACMTGDGVNDVLAMKEASCSVAMITGSEASRSACDFVLMTGDFSAMVQVLQEGRRVINNIENVASLYLVKTIYSTILSLIYIFLPYPYPYDPLQMTPINALTVGIPSFVLALRPNYRRPEGRFVANILENSAPAAISVVFCVLVVQLAGICFGLTEAEISTMNVFLTAVVGFTLLYKLAKPLTGWLRAMMLALVATFLCCIIFFGWFFDLDSLFTRNMFFYLPLAYIAPRMFHFLGNFVEKIEDKLLVRKGQAAPALPAAEEEPGGEGSAEAPEGSEE